MKSHRVRKIIAYTILVFACASVLLAQGRPQCDSFEYLVKIGEMTTDLTPNGITAADSMTVFPDGRFHLQRRFQQLPNRTVTLKIFESSLNEDQLKRLKSILENASIKELPPYVKPAIPLSAPWFGVLRVNIARGSESQDVGYWVWKGGTPETPPNSAPDEMKKDWRDSQIALQPLVEWFRSVESLKLAPVSDEKTMWCRVGG